MKLTKLTQVTVAAGILAMQSGIHPAAAQSSDALLNKLVEKGILTAKEAGDLKEEDKKSSPKNFAAKLGAPEWVERINFRGLYDGIWQDSSNEGLGTATADRDRFRYRLRYGVTAELADHFEVGLRL